MVRPDKRRSKAERVILGFLALHYGPLGSTYEEIVQGTKLRFHARPGREGLSLRQVIRHVSTFLSKGWVSQTIVAGTGRFSITLDGYIYYHRDLEGRDVSSLSVVPKELLPPLMAKGIWRLTGDQARYFREYLNQDGSLLVLLPAGAGKTLIATVEAYEHYRKGPSGNSKVLYLSPYKAINSQSTAEFCRVLGPLGVLVARQDGDHHTPREELLKANLVVSTFESAQFSFYRGDEWIQQIAVVIVDELTILDATRDRAQGGLKLPRGANLDLLITSLLHSFGMSGREVKFVCLGTPNASQPALQRWLGNGTTILGPSERFERCEEKVAVFEKRDSGEEWYLERKDGVRSEGPYNLATASDMQRMLTVILHYLKKLYASSEDKRIKPVLVFVRSRKDASESAIRLQDLVAKDPVLASAMRKGRPDNSYRIGQSVVMPTSTVKQLSEVVNMGIGFHHAGLFHAQRRVVEQMMNDGSLSVLFATTTLAHGVDFPVGAVIIDAQLLRMLGYSRLEYLQLKGRVDHKDPFHETSGMADAVVVMSEGRAAQDYDRVRELLQGVDVPLDSCSLAPFNARTFMLRAVQYFTSQTGTAGAEQLTAFAKRTYYLQHVLQGATATSASAVGRSVENQSEGVIKWCERHGLVSRGQKGFTLAALGNIADQTGLGFFDASIISGRVKRLLNSSLNSSLERLTIGLLSLALGLVESSDEVGELIPRARLYERVPAKLRKETERLAVGGHSLHHGVLVAILDKWIEERPISEIVVDKPEFQVYESGLLTSARAAARNLRTIAEAVEMLGREKSDGTEQGAYSNLAETSRLLGIRVRYGVGHDIASSELGRIASRVFLDDLVNSQGYPEFLMRIALRMMMKKGWSNAAKLREYKGKTPITATDLRGYTLDREAAEHLKFHRDQLNEVALRIIQLAKLESEPTRHG